MKVIVLLLMKGVNVVFIVVSMWVWSVVLMFGLCSVWFIGFSRVM